MDRASRQPSLKSPLPTEIPSDLVPEPTISQRLRERRWGLTRQRHRQLTRTDALEGGIMDINCFSSTSPASRYPSPPASPSSSSSLASSTNALSSSSSDATIRISTTITTTQRKRQLSATSRRTIIGSSSRRLRQRLPTTRNRSSSSAIITSVYSPVDVDNNTASSHGAVMVDRSSRRTTKPYSRSRAPHQRYHSHLFRVLVSPPSSSSLSSTIIRNTPIRLRHRRRISEVNSNDDDEVQLINLRPGSLRFLDLPQTPQPLDLSTPRDIDFILLSPSSSPRSSVLEQQHSVRRSTRLSASLVSEAGVNEECAICKEDEKTDRSVLLPCMHTYCFACIKRWVMINPTCPLCKQVTERLVHDIRSDTQFCEVSIAELRVSSSRRGGSGGGSVVINREANNQTLSIFADWVHAYHRNSEFPGESDRHRILIAGLVINAFPLYQNNQIEPLLLRQLIYILNLCSVPVVLGESERLIRSTEPSFLADNEALQHRLIAFVRRELCALTPWLVYTSCNESVTAPLFMCPPPFTQATDQEGISALDRIANRVVEYACQVPISDTARFVAMLRQDSTFVGGWDWSLPELPDLTLEHFCREFEQFARFSGTLEEYDNVVCLFRSCFIRPEYNLNPPMHLATYIGAGCGLQISGFTSSVTAVQRALISRIYDSFFRSSVTEYSSSSSIADVHFSSSTPDPLDPFAERRPRNIFVSNYPSMSDVDKNAAAIDFANHNSLLEPIVHSMIASSMPLSVNRRVSRSITACALLSYANKVALVRGRRAVHSLCQAILRELLMNTRWGSPTSRDRSMQRLQGLVSLFPSTDVDSLMTTRLTNPLTVMELDGGETGSLFQRNWAPLRLSPMNPQPRSPLLGRSEQLSINTENNNPIGGISLSTPRFFDVDLIDVVDETIIEIDESVEGDEEPQPPDGSNQGTPSSPINLDADVGDGPSPKRSRIYSETPIEVFDSSSDSSDLEVEDIQVGSTGTLESRRSLSGCCADSGRDKNCCCALKQLWERTKCIGPAPEAPYNAFFEFSRAYFDRENNLSIRNWDRRASPLINRPSSPIVISDGECDGEENLENVVDLSEEDRKTDSPQPVPSTSAQHLDNVSDVEKKELKPADLSGDKSPRLTSQDTSTIYRPQTAEDFYAFFEQLIQHDPLNVSELPNSNLDTLSIVAAGEINSELDSKPPRPTINDDDSANDRQHRPASVA